MRSERDVIIIGGGPAGLALASSLSKASFSVTVLEKQPLTALADPPPDGRDIALTHRSVAILKSLGIWSHIPQAEIAAIRSAQVENASGGRALHFHPGRDHSVLGYLVANHLIRKAAFKAATRACAGHPEVELLAGSDVTGLHVEAGRASVTLAGGQKLEARLIVSADSRFSESRRRMGIAAHMHDFGRTVIVCRMKHEGAADGVVHECFQRGHTLAVLPMNDRQSSIVVTIPSQDAERLMRMEPAAFAALIEEYFASRLGRMELAGERHRYPLVAVYARHFVAERFALLGDAAVGMHPVTAHGYNFGLYGVEALTETIRDARAAGRDFGSLEVLRRYQRIHRQATLPIFLGTNALVKLYTDDRPLAGAVRAGLLRAADKIGPLKNWITGRLTDTPQPLPQTGQAFGLRHRLAALRPPRRPA